MINKISKEFVKDWCITILRFMSDQYREDDNYGGRNYKTFFNDKIERLTWAIENYGEKVMKTMFREISDFAMKEAKNKDKLNRLLLEKFGQSLDDNEKEIQKIIEKIIKRGRINSTNEFYLVKSYIDDLLIQGNKKVAQKLDLLLFNYEKNK